MFATGNYPVYFIVFTIALICIMIQKFFKKYLESDQYYYLKDVTLVGAWALCGVWMPDGPMRITIAAGVAAACVGFCQRATKIKHLRFLYFLIGCVFSFFGPRIAFIEFSVGEYYYLSYLISVVISAIWVGLFTAFFQEVDEIPGMCGVMLTVSWTMISTVILISSQNFKDASQLCITGLIMIAVFWNRHIYAYRRLTEPLTGLWGTLLAGISVLSVSRGITFYTLALLPIGLFIIPAAETVISLFVATIFEKPTGGMLIYRKLIRRGFTHYKAIIFSVGICSVFGILLSFVQFGLREFLFLTIVILVVFFIITMVYKYTVRSGKMNSSCRKPVLWGVAVDNISLNYALSKVNHWLTTEHAAAHIIVTPDALATLRSRKDKKYHTIVKEAGLVLPDGNGLIGALKLIGTPVQERIPGVEFTEHICKLAAESGRRVWILGGEDGVALKASEVLRKKYTGLIIAGTRNGFFSENEIPNICKSIKDAKTDILFVGLGVPKQEYWLYDNLESTGAVVGMGIGGSMDVISGNLKRAPKIWQKLGLEWLYRTIQEPWRWKRLTKLPVFVFYVLLTCLHLDTYKNDDFIIKC